MFLGAIIVVGVFIFLTLVGRILELQKKLKTLNEDYNRQGEFYRAKLDAYFEKLCLVKIGMHSHTSQMKEFINLLYYTEDNVPKLGRKLADLVLSSKENNKLYGYFEYMLSQHNLIYENKYSLLKERYSLTDKDVMICFLLSNNYESYHIWTICNSNENAYYTRCSRLRTKLQLSQNQSIVSFLKENGY